MADKDTGAPTHRISGDSGGAIMAGKEEEVVRPIEEVLSDIAKEIPQEEWDKLPEDLNDNLDHYLYGGPKK
ncbi:MAG: hypothetical protein JW821_09525 [Deltaproteobacteria bacterium]|nr:hypothetical protein [Deltaproteobacteria bacterium]